MVNAFTSHKIPITVVLVLLSGGFIAGTNGRGMPEEALIQAVLQTDRCRRCPLDEAYTSGVVVNAIKCHTKPNGMLLRCADGTVVKSTTWESEQLLRLGPRHPKTGEDVECALITPTILAALHNMESEGNLHCTGRLGGIHVHGNYDEFLWLGFPYDRVQLRSKLAHMHKAGHL